jgi:FdhD protein
MEHASDRYRVWRHQQGGPLVTAEDDVAREEPLAVRVAGQCLSVTMRTPGHDDELALGFLLSEGVLSRPEDVRHVGTCSDAGGEAIDVVVSPEVAVDFKRLTRHVFATASCGVCGSTSIEAVRRRWPIAAPGPVVAADMLYRAADALAEAQPVFRTTGGLHAAGLFEAEGRLVVVREDVGRHNAVDKVLGHAFRAALLPLSRHFLLVSGRASFEVVHKALAAGVGIVAAVSAPSSLAIDLALEGNLTLVGFLRPGRLTVYAHPERIRASRGTPQPVDSATATAL